MNDDAKVRKSLWRRLAKWGGIGVAALLILGVLAWSIAGVVTARQVRAEIAKIEAAGDPLTWSDLGADAAPGDAGRHYAAAMELVDVPGSYYDQAAFHALLGKAEFSPSDRDAAERILAHNRHGLDLLRHAVSLEGGHADLGVRWGIDREELDLAGVRRTASRRVGRLQQFATAILLIDGRHDEALESIIVLLRMLRIYENQRTMLLHLVEAALRSVTYWQVSLLLERAELSEAGLGRLADAIAAVEDPEAYTRALLAERVSYIETLEVLLAEEAAYEYAIPYVPRAVRRAALAGYLRDMGRLIEASREPWPQKIDAVRGVEAETLGGHWAGITRYYHLLPEHPIVGEGARLAEARATRLAVAVERYRRAHDRLPATLAELTPDYIDAVLDDPFTGDPMIYRIEDEGYVIYSVGDDGWDSGGQLERPHEADAHDEVGPQDGIVFPPLPSDFGIRITLR